MRISISKSLTSNKGVGGVTDLNFQTGDYRYRGARYATPQAIPQWSQNGTPTIDGSGISVPANISNLVASSLNLANAAVWKGLNSATAATSAVTDPVGGTNATLLTFPSVAGTISLQAAAFVQVGSSAACKHAIWMKTTSGTFKLKISRTDTTTWVGSTVSSEITVTTTWTRYFLDVTTGSGGLSDFVIGAESKTPYNMPATGSVLVYNPQITRGSSVVADVPTAAAIPATAFGGEYALANPFGTKSVTAIVDYNGTPVEVPVLSELNLGASSGGAWVGSSVRSVQIVRDTTPKAGLILAALKTAEDAVVAVNAFTFNDATTGWLAAPSYAKPFIADFWLAASQYAGKFTATQIYNMYRKFILAADGSGNLPISILPTTAAGSDYFSGLDTLHNHTGGDPIFCIPLLMKQFYTLSGLTTNFAADLAVLKAALLSVPRNGSTHLVSAGTGAGSYWISWGFHDGIKSSGDEMIGSVFYYAAALAMVDLYTAIGDTVNAAAFSADAALIAANIDTLWDATNGMYLAATGLNNQIDVNASAMASYFGLASAPKKTAIAAYLAANYDWLFNASGYVRQSPIPWASNWGGLKYDDFSWSWGNYYVFKALAVGDQGLAEALMFRMATGSNTAEYQIGDTAFGAANNLVSATAAIRYLDEALAT